MNLKKCIFTKNRCYTNGQTIVPKGVMVHSTGANNPTLARYVAPDDGLIGVNQYGNDWNNPSVGVCVHAFIGKLADGSIATYQTLPWNYRAWHCASGVKGSANNTHISFEICEDALTDKTYFSKVYREAVELTAMLCVEYNLDPMGDGVVICHSEGCDRGIASNHGDVMHWFPRFGVDMDTFREDVKFEIEELEDNDMTQAQFDVMMENYLKRRGELAEPDWSVASGEFARAKANGITDGTRPLDYCTRLEASIMNNRVLEKAK